MSGPLYSHETTEDVSIGDLQPEDTVIIDGERFVVGEVWPGYVIITHPDGRPHVRHETDRVQRVVIAP